MEPSIFIGLGSNVGDRARAIARSLEALEARSCVEVARASALYATEPMYVLDQPPFLNAVAELRSSLEPEALLAALLEVEARLGRVRDRRRGPRAIDLDLLAYDDRIVTGASLLVPHPGIAERLFVLEPWAEIAPDFRPPGLGASVAELRDAARAGGYRSAPRKLSPIDHGTSK